MPVSFCDVTSSTAPGRDRGVDGVAALPQDLEAGLRRQRIARRHHAVPREHFGASLRRPALRARAGHRLDARCRSRLVERGDAERVGRLRSSRSRPDQERRDHRNRDTTESSTAVRRS